MYQALQAIATPAQPPPCAVPVVVACDAAIDPAGCVETAEAAEARALAAGLARSKCIVYGLHRSGLSAAQIAQQRHIQVATATGYLADAALVGLAVSPQLAGVSDATRAALLERLDLEEPLPEELKAATPALPPSRAEAVAAATEGSRVKMLIAAMRPHEVTYSEVKLVVALFEHSRLARRRVSTPPPGDDAPVVPAAASDDDVER